MKKPILLVGAGISGLTLALELEQAEIPFELIDSGKNKSSRVAAGIINPLVFRRMALSWRIAEFLPETIRFYKKLEAETGKKYLNPIPIRRAFAHQQEADLWLKKQDEAEYLDFMKKLDDADFSNQTVNNTFGTGLVKNSYHISTQELLDDLQDKFRQEGKLRTEEFAYRQFDPETIQYQGKAYEKVVFCEGYQGIYNPWFSYLPLQATKGEILKISSDEIPENESLNRRCFVLPLGNRQFKVGSTYVWDCVDASPSEEGYDLLMENIANLTKAKVEVLEHVAGIRPTVPDRRPLLGEHPFHKNLFIFNGLGAKGFLSAPLLAKLVIKQLLTGDEPDPEISIERYRKFWA